MARKNTYKTIVILAGFTIAIVIILGVIIPDMGWWNLTYKSGIITWEYDLNAFGFFTSTNGESEFLGDYLILLPGLMVLIGAIFISLGAIKENKGITILSGFIVIFGIILFCVGLSTNDDWEDLNILIDFLSGSDNLVFWGSLGDFSWGLSIGFYLSVICAGIAIVSSFYM
ncbi:MAG: hypothetical protein JXA99_12830 [Candidatus Lokiarchaeota archaeon]|nr:hypothetical protein [Candidatus Lokiarchaeota archaeon]